MGIGGIQNNKFYSKKFDNKASALAEDQLKELSGQLDTFQTNLETFARDHKDEIKKDPEFRRHFQEMCASIGVDPLASGKGFWSNMLDIGDFYYELGVQIVEVCMASAHRTGGLMELGQIRTRLIKARGRSAHHQDITTDDLLRATKKLKILGTGFTVIALDSGRYLVQSVPGELSMDQTAVLKQAETAGGAVGVDQLASSLGWSRERSVRALDQLLGAGLIWIDSQTGGEPVYWVPSIFTSNIEK